MFWCCWSANANAGAVMLPVPFDVNKVEVFVPNFATAKLVSVYDGDTVTVATWEGTRWCKFKVRIDGVDCAEMRTKDVNEKKVAVKAKEWVEKMLTEAVEVKYVSKGADKYGRQLCEVWVRSTERGAFVSVGAELLAKKLAVVYHGGKKESVQW